MRARFLVNAQEAPRGRRIAEQTIIMLGRSNNSSAVVVAKRAEVVNRKYLLY